ncbi:hypothetical protein NDA11_001303 [Ustilago hordei]|uniref:BTB domain-containing protein n=1 Tax=Ustilago hordei TaxID=120017 RepID=I2FUF3_USTHO|nr:uncharacterized protein UHO2_04981 [Ustilago hordei]KAJ1043266.1 hypothetical protein NDA10_007697 [Ustilago hordei]KAJ1572921.1 hypothetical protein NDA12_000476 [Ustilago hordei]KAJ1577452.1 hypothetical protein NDA11_001303 [Ustilago hordei]KAJ1582233.1 hypothetical protein NDA15_006259 [Ustilago hordei]KAJ1597741.1 hypothetical protein NDA14_002713 [Ustilago hordei]
MSRSPNRPRSSDLSPPVDKVSPSETHSITFEWPLHDLKQHFDSSNNDAKSKVIKSVPFGEGRWTVLFYAQSGMQSFCSLYLNAEPTPEEKSQSKPSWENYINNSSLNRSQASISDKNGNASEDAWTRQGLFRFTFKIITLNKGFILASKEACNHAFSHKTSNWGWAQFASRDTVFYGNSEVQQTNGFLISVTITASPETPRPLSVGVTIPPALIEAMGSLLDDPDHSDVVFVIRRKRRHPTSGAIVTRERRIYAIKKILASRCEYFRDMFESGFLEADATTSSDDEGDDDLAVVPASSRGVGQDQLGLMGSAFLSSGEDEDDDLGLEDSDEEMDVDEVYELGRSNFQDQYRGSEGSLARASQPGLALSPNGGAEQSASRRMRETSSDVPQLQSFTSATASQPSDSVQYGKSQQYTPPQSRTRQSNELDAGTDSGDDAARAQGMSAFKTPQHSPRELRSEGARFTSPTKGASAPLSKRQTRSSKTQVAKEQGSNAKTLPQRRKSDEAPGTSAHTSKKRRKVIVHDAAYATYKALLYYLYTDTVAFAPLHSHFYSQTTTPDNSATVQENLDLSETKPSDSSTASATYAGSESGLHSSRCTSTTNPTGSFAKDRRRAHLQRQHVIDEYCSSNTSIPSPCSAKSMYRLADKLQIPELKARAQEELANNLTVDNIVWEVFSGFNAQFPAIRKMETDFLLKHWGEVKGTDVMKSIFSRPAAHPGLADVWPLLLSQLEFRGGGSAGGSGSGGEKDA